MKRNTIRLFILVCMAFLFIGVVNAQAGTKDSPESKETRVHNEERLKAKRKLQKNQIKEHKVVKEKLKNASQVEVSTGTDKFTDEEWKRLAKEGGKEIAAFNKSLEEERREFQAGLKKERKAFFESVKGLKGKERGKAISGFNQRQKEKRQAFHQAQKEKRKAFIKERKADKAGVRKQFHKKSPKRHGGPPKGKA